MGWFQEDSLPAKAYNDYQSSGVNKEHEANWAHELIAGAASYEAAKAYEQHCERNGKPQSHEEAKQIMAGLAGAFIDREAETKGLDFVDRERAKRHAKQHIDDVPSSQLGY